MNISRLLSRVIVLTAVFAASSCVDSLDTSSPADKQRKVNFDVLVTRDGQTISSERRGVMTKNSPLVEESEKTSTMNTDIPFGLMGIDDDTYALLVDNAKVGQSGGSYSTFLDPSRWSEMGTSAIAFSAYYPYVSSVNYSQDLVSYVIPYSVEDTDAGPLVSKTVKMAVALLNMVPLEFQHITNDIGYRICDITPMPELQGLVHLKKMTAYNVASAGVFVNDLARNTGLWRHQGYYRDVVIFEGDAKVGVGSSNEKFVGYDSLEDHMATSHRYYSVPDEIVMGKQYVEVVYDIDGFTLNGFDYPPLKNQVARFMLYGLLPDNVFVYGKQYTFHVGIDLSTVYSEICFTASVSGWENSIYENNDEF
ncbi:MAG: hypothetical protein IKH11_00595 [Bacteroidales bacterium]|nr:hypothetical protein [Bacteroidales bacterium]